MVFLSNARTQLGRGRRLWRGRQWKKGEQPWPTTNCKCYVAIATSQDDARNLNGEGHSLPRSYGLHDPLESSVFRPFSESNFYDVQYPEIAAGLTAQTAGETPQLWSASPPFIGERFLIKQRRVVGRSDLAMKLVRRSFLIGRTARGRREEAGVPRRLRFRRRRRRALREFMKNIF